MRRFKGIGFSFFEGLGGGRSIEKFDCISVAFCEDDVGGGLVHLHGHSQWDEAVNSVVDVVDI